MNIKVSSLVELEAEAVRLIEFLHEKAAEITAADGGAYGKAVVVGLSGDLGAGKTAFSQCVARLLGVEEQVTSPTFVIEKIYKTKDAGKFETFVHIDAYRLDEGKELQTLGFADVVNYKNNLVFIEWPEKVKEALPAETMFISFTTIDENTRELAY